MARRQFCIWVPSSRSEPTSRRAARRGVCSVELAIGKSDEWGRGWQRSRVRTMLDGWQENFAIKVANRTQGDERVMLHLGDRLWGVRGEVAAAHLCYVVADANLEPYSGNARLCVIGVDHVNNPRNT